jgi:DNA-binding transcriptional regulator YdaS (Cro superfamily)
MKIHPFGVVLSKKQSNVKFHGNPSVRCRIIEKHSNVKFHENPSVRSRIFEKHSNVKFHENPSVRCPIFEKTFECQISWKSIRSVSYFRQNIRVSNFMKIHPFGVVFSKKHSNVKFHENPSIRCRIIEKTVEYQISWKSIRSVSYFRKNIRVSNFMKIHSFCVVFSKKHSNVKFHENPSIRCRIIEKTVECQISWKSIRSVSYYRKNIRMLNFMKTSVRCRIFEKKTFECQISWKSIRSVSYFRKTFECQISWKSIRLVSSAEEGRTGIAKSIDFFPRICNRA